MNTLHRVILSIALLAATISYAAPTRHPKAYSAHPAKIEAAKDLVNAYYKHIEKGTDKAHLGKFLAMSELQVIDRAIEILSGSQEKKLHEQRYMDLLSLEAVCEKRALVKHDLKGRPVSGAILAYSVKGTCVGRHLRHERVVELSYDSGSGKWLIIRISDARS